MASSYFLFLTAFILLTFIQGGIMVQPTPLSVTGENDSQNYKVVDMRVLLNRIDQLEAKVKQHEVKVNRQQTEINQLKKKTSDLEEKTRQLTLKANGKEDDAASHGSSLLPRSCFEVKAANPNAQSGVYSIDPDGRIGGDPPIKVYCDMETRSTSIYHDIESKTNITACLDPGCYTKAIKYNATMRQLAMLVDISTSCKQHIRFDSTGVPLEYKNTQYGFWNDRNNKKQIFWAGSATNTHTCQCGIMNNCVERSSKCNADSLAPIELVDEGFITATELLPVTRLSFGRTSLAGVKASYTLGRFKCTGQATISYKPTNCQDLFKIGYALNGFYHVDGGNNQIASVYCDFTKSSTETGFETRYGPATRPAAVSSKPTSCRDLFKMGQTLSGFYDVKGGNNQIEAIYCDFSKSSTATGYETRYGFVDVKSNPVHFFVTRTSDWSTVGTMPFEKEHLNLGGGMNLASGVFTAPKTGIYAFSFKGMGNALGYSGPDAAGYGWVFLQRNGADVATGYTTTRGATSDTKTTLSVHGTLKLNKGDRITIHFSGGKIYSNQDIHIQFTGSLLEEDLVIS